ncbi:MAG: hypothetical protein USCGTAYLOR_02366 [Chromatiales bacterium USCg_Taylor]|nr:MAG: hypothetical protein USCGTAYLOR_02366 [Chromatiales bacterium USCg_Taylor]
MNHAARPDEVISSNALGIPYVEWPAILAGALLSAAFAFVMVTFGSAIGLSVASPYSGEGWSRTGFIIATGLWTLWVIVSSLMAGGYLAGRMRRRIADVTDHEVEVRDGVHGLVVWALATLFGAYLATTATLGVAKAGAEVAGTVTAEVAGKALEKVDPLSLTADRLLRSNASVSSEEIGRILAASVDSEASPSSADRQYLVDVVASRAGLPQEQAAARVDEAFAAARQLSEEAKAAAEAARKLGILLAFLTAASLLAGAAGGWWAATIGGHHRDERTDFSRLTRWRR